MPVSSDTPPALLLAPGAGAGSDSAWMVAWAERLRSLGRVEPFDYRYRLEGRKAPDRLPKLITRHREAFDQLAPTPPGKVILVGKSMGSRVGCHLTLQEGMAGRVAGLICFGYPLKAAGKSGKIRDEVLVGLRPETPILFVQGTKDPMGPLDLFAEVRERMQTRSELHVVEGGNHSLQCGKRFLKQAELTQDDVDDRILAAVATFVESLRSDA